MYTFPKHHIHYHILVVLLAVWGVVFKLDLFQAQAQGSLTLSQPIVVCINNIPNVSLSWTPLATADTYSVERKEGDTSVMVGWAGPIMSQLRTTMFIDTHYAPDYGRMMYSYRIVAYKGLTPTYSNAIAVLLPECVRQPVDPFSDIATSTTAVYGATTTLPAASSSLALPIATSTVSTATTTKTTKAPSKKKVTTKPPVVITPKPVVASTPPSTPTSSNSTSTQATAPTSGGSTSQPPVVPVTTPAPVIIQPVIQAPVVSAPLKKNSPPIGYLELPQFATSTIVQGTTISFMGSGDDSDGRIVAYEWRLASCATGTVVAMSASFSKADFPKGLTYVYFRVKDNAGDWSINCQRRAIIVSAPVVPPVVTPTPPVVVTPPANIIPTTTITSPASSNTTVSQGTKVTFTGIATDQDGTISQYEWRDGNCTTGTLLSNATSFSKTDFSVGNHTMYFRAKDNKGAWSTSCISRVIAVTAVVATTTVVATQPVNKIPTTTITFPTFATSSILAGDILSFSGTATDSDGGIASYEWRDGDCITGTLLSTATSFSKGDFTLGIHQIYFRAKDNKGAWSSVCQKRAVTVAALVATTTPVVIPPIVTPTTPTTTTSTPNTSGKFPSWMKWGMFVGWQDTAMSNFESLTGKQPQMEALFAHWGNDQFPSTFGTRIRDKGRTMVLFWEAVDYNRDYFSQPEYSFDSVIAGKMDAYFTKFAADAKAYGGEVILVPYSEFNGDWFPWGMTSPGNTPEKFKKSWIHIHNFFANVPNVKFGWVPNNDSVPDIPANDFDLNYPGSQYVDIVGIDGFNSNPWETFDQMMGKELIKLEKYNKPIYIMSMGVKNDARKAAWITDAFTNQLYKYPKVKGWVWFNENKEFDWRVNSTTDSLNAFKAMLP